MNPNSISTDVKSLVEQTFNDLELDVEPKSKANFRKVELSSHNSRNTPFDAASIMMYGPKDFGLMDSRGRRKTTIKPLQPGIELRL